MTSHGHCRKNAPRSREYDAFAAMKQRCYYKKNKEYHRYGGRGIAMCDRWLHGEAGKSGFCCFLEDMGLKPTPEHTVERNDVNSGYSPENCRWATRQEQLNNRTNTARDGDKTISQLVAETGIKYQTIMDRWRRGERGEELVRPVTPKEDRWKRRLEKKNRAGMLR
jgi:hypothetical protein